MKKILSLMVSVVAIALFAGGAVSAEHTMSTDLMNTDDTQQENIVEQKENAQEAIKKKAKVKKSHKKKEQGKLAKASKKLAPGQLLNINTASKKELAMLPGIGSAKAQAIIDGRPYKTKEDIMKVRGVKKGMFEKIKDTITL